MATSQLMDLIKTDIKPKQNDVSSSKYTSKDSADKFSKVFETAKKTQENSYNKEYSYRYEDAAANQAPEQNYEIKQEREKPVTREPKAEAVKEPKRTEKKAKITEEPATKKEEKTDTKPAATTQKEPAADTAGKIILEKADTKPKTEVKTEAKNTKPETNQNQGQQIKQLNAETKEAKTEIKTEDKTEVQTGAKTNTGQQIKQLNTEVKQVKTEIKAEIKPETKTEAKPEAKPEIKPEAKPEAKPEVKVELNTTEKPTEKAKNTPPPSSKILEKKEELKIEEIKITNNSETQKQTKEINLNLAMNQKKQQQQQAQQELKPNINTNQTASTETSGQKINLQSAASFEKILGPKQTANTQQSILNQVKDASSQLTKGKSEVTIALKPENLGRVNLNLVSQKGVLTAQITAENQQVKEMLTKGMENLRQNLSEQGINVGRINITIQETNQTNNNSNFDQAMNKFEQQNGQSTSNSQTNKQNNDETALGESTDLEYETEETANNEIDNNIRQNPNGSVDYKV